MYLRAAIYHPDKAVNPEEHANAEIYFVKFKSAQDTLTDATKRFAYERFGPDVLKWQHVSSIRDYILVGLQTVAPMYGGSIAFMILLSLFGYLQWGRYVGSLANALSILLPRLIAEASRPLTHPHSGAISSSLVLLLWSTTRSHGLIGHQSSPRCLTLSSRISHRIHQFYRSSSLPWPTKQPSRSS